jgi:hypothetical protein
MLVRRESLVGKLTFCELDDASSILGSGSRVLLGFQVLTVASTKMTAFWDIAPCSLVEVDRRFSVVYCGRHRGNGFFHFTTAVFRATLMITIIMTSAYQSYKTWPVKC